MKNLLSTLFIFSSLALLILGNVSTSCAGDPMTLTGTVVETMDGGGYTYVNIENSGKKTWVAIPMTNVVKGQNISFLPGSEMLDFESKTMKRRFDRIIFSGGVIGETGMESGMKDDGIKGNAVPPEEPLMIEKASGPNAYTVEELYKGGAKLDNKNIVVRGKVIKVAAGIMNKNWIHLRDGSGDAKDGSNDLVMTSNDLPVVGDVVTASGTLHSNRDFGSGYKYTVIIENTIFTH